MKFSFKKVVAAALAATMTLGCVPAFATPSTDPTVAVVIGDTYDLSTGGGLFAKQNAKTTQTSSDNRFITDGKIDGSGVGLKTGESTGLKLLTPSDPDGCKLVITNDNEKSYKVTYDGFEGESISQKVYKTGKIPADTVVTILPTNSSATQIHTIQVKTGADPTKFYSISGTVKVNGVAKAGIPVVLEGSDDVTNPNVTTGDDGSYTFEHVGNLEGVTVSIAATAEYFGASKEVPAPSANVTGVDFDLRIKETPKEISEPIKVDLIAELTGANDEPLEEDVVIGGYFKVVGDGMLLKVDNGSVYALEAGKREAGTLQFTTTKAFDIIIECSSTGDKGSNIAIIKSGTDYAATGTCQYSAVNTAFKAENIPAGTYTIGAPTKADANTDKAVRLYSIKFVEAGQTKIADTAVKVGSDYTAVDADNTYIIHPVTEGEKEKNSLSLGNNKTAVTGTTTDTVYTAVQFGDSSTITAADIGADTLYAVCVSGTNGAAPKDKFEWISE